MEACPRAPQEQEPTPPLGVPMVRGFECEVRRVTVPWEPLDVD